MGSSGFFEVEPDRHRPSVELLYITDRAPSKPTIAQISGKGEELRCEDISPYPLTSDNGDPFSADRMRCMSYGTVEVDFGDADWDTLKDAKRKKPLYLRLAKTQEMGRFPRLMYPVEELDKDGEEYLRRDPKGIEAHEEAAKNLQKEISRRIGYSKRKELVLYVHGYNTGFEEAAFRMAELCHFLGRGFVCAIFSWPAKNSIFKYLEDRESGEFAVEDLKKAIRIVAATPSVEHIHLIAHSRGSDILATVTSELNIETYASGRSLGTSFKIANVVLFAPDLDWDITISRFFKVVSDPDLPWGGTKHLRTIHPGGRCDPDRPLASRHDCEGEASSMAYPDLQFPKPKLRLTVYVNRKDKILRIAERLFGKSHRLGRVDIESLCATSGNNDRDPRARDLEQAKMLGKLDTIQFSGTTDFFGHSYFIDDPLVSSDLIALIRGAGTNGECRPLDQPKGCKNIGGWLLLTDNEQWENRAKSCKMP